MSAYREGKRIRHENGMGYSDLVPDEEIQRHISDHRWALAHVDYDPARKAQLREDLAFAETVLSLRAAERILSGPAVVVPTGEENDQ